MASRTKSRGERRKPRSSNQSEESGFAANWRSWLLAILLIAGVVVAVLHWGDVKKFGALVSHSQPLWLIAAAAAQLLTYVALAAQWALVLRAGKCRAPFGKLLGLTVGKHFADQMVPTAGMSGNVVVVDRLQGIGASRAVALATLIMTIIAYYASYGLASLLALILLWLHGQTSWVVVALISASLGLSAAVPALALWLQRNQARPERTIDRRADSAERRGLRARRADDAVLPVRFGRAGVLQRRVQRVHHGLDRRHARADPDGAGIVRSGQHRHASRNGHSIRGGSVGDLAVPRLHFVGAAYPGNVRCAAPAQEQQEKEKAR